MTQSIYNYHISNRAVKTLRLELIFNHVSNYNLFKEIKKKLLTKFYKIIL